MMINNMRISVITPSIRPQFLGITYDSLKAQTFKDFEWLIEVDMPSDKFLLPIAMNNALRRAKGEIILILQDCISIPDNFLQHVNDTYNGDFVTYPMGKIEKSPYLNIEDKIKWDWRKDSMRQAKDFVEANHWESDLAIAPRKAFFDIGGYDEKFCEGWSWENVEVAYRAEAAGYKFRCDNRVFGTAIDHDDILPHPFRGVLKNNDARARDTKIFAEIGDYKLGYLTSTEA